MNVCEICQERKEDAGMGRMGEKLFIIVLLVVSIWLGVFAENFDADF
jgi:hypothetical protein